MNCPGGQGLGKRKPLSLIKTVPLISPARVRPSWLKKKKRRVQGRASPRHRNLSVILTCFASSPLPMPSNLIPTQPILRLTTCLPQTTAPSSTSAGMIRQGWLCQGLFIALKAGHPARSSRAEPVWPPDPGCQVACMRAAHQSLLRACLSFGTAKEYGNSVLISVEFRAKREILVAAGTNNLRGLVISGNPAQS